MNDTPFAFAQPEWLGETPSTNDELRERAARDGAPPSGFVLAAHRQTRGRGRMNSVWQSAGGGDLTFSFHWRGDADPLTLGSLPMACALGVRDFLALPQNAVSALCKWPNDVLVGDAKICGILSEGGRLASGGFAFIIGIGVNIRSQPERDRALGRRTAALEDFRSSPPDAETLLPPLLERLADRITLWQRGGFAAIRGDITACLWGLGREVAAKTPRGPVRGTVIGLGEHGELLLRTADGGETRVSSVTALEEGWDGAGFGSVGDS